MGLSPLFRWSLFPTSAWEWEKIATIEDSHLESVSTRLRKRFQRFLKQRYLVSIFIGTIILKWKFKQKVLYLYIIEIIPSSYIYFWGLLCSLVLQMTRPRDETYYWLRWQRQQQQSLLWRHLCNILFELRRVLNCRVE